jgi:hypothetical protein
MNVQSFNFDLANTSKTLINFNKYSDNIINNVFIKNSIFKELNEKFYKIDISFIDDFLKLVGTNECIIPHMMLEKYGVLKIKGEKQEDTTTVKRLLKKQLKLPENLYLNDKVVVQLPSGKKYKNKYLLSPYAFKLCLMRSQNTRNICKLFLVVRRLC